MSPFISGSSGRRRRIRSGRDRLRDTSRRPSCRDTGFRRSSRPAVCCALRCEDARAHVGVFRKRQRREARARKSAATSRCYGARFFAAFASRVDLGEVWNFHRRRGRSAFVARVIARASRPQHRPSGKSANPNNVDPADHRTTSAEYRCDQVRSECAAPAIGKRPCADLSRTSSEKYARFGASSTEHNLPEWPSAPWHTWVNR